MGAVGGVEVDELPSQEKNDFVFCFLFGMEVASKWPPAIKESIPERKEEKQLVGSLTDAVPP